MLVCTERFVMQAVGGAGVGGFLPASSLQASISGTFTGRKEGCREAVLGVWEEECRKAMLGAWEEGRRKAVLGVWEEGCRKAVLGVRASR